MRPRPPLMWMLFAIGSVLCCWALLRNVGNERERAIRLIEDQIRVEKEAAEARAREEAAMKLSAQLAAMNPPPKSASTATKAAPAPAAKAGKK